MARAGMRILSDKDYLDPGERKKRAKQKQEDLITRRLTPDWFHKEELRLPPDLKVAVIGAGFAGLSAAWYLNDCGVQVTLYEPRPDVGGRVESDKIFVPGKVIENGAELIGENHALWNILADRFNLTPLVPLTDYPNERLRFGNRELTASEKSALMKSLKAPLAELGAIAQPIPEVNPWQFKDAGKYDAQSVAQGLNALTAKPTGDALKWFEFTLSNDNCAPIAQQSYLGMLAALSAGRMGDDARGMLGYWMSTETHRCKGGNHLLAFNIRKKITGSGQHTQLNLRTAVTQVHFNPLAAKPVTIVFEERDQDNNFVKKDRDVFDFAILTAPPTVWNDIKFKNILDRQKLAIQNGDAVKFMARYATRFWEDNKLPPVTKWDQIGSVWEGTDNQGDKPDFDLTVFSGGPYIQTEAEYLKRLAILYPKSKPVDYKRVDWTQAEHIKAGYAIPGVGQGLRVWPNLAQPYEDRLYFAGEQTSPGFFGYMEGALQSGAQAALKIVARSAFFVRPQRTP